MKITKKLKYATFVYDEELKEFTIKTTPHGESESGYAVGGNSIKLNKIYSFAFMRFVIRMAQRNWLRSNKIVDKTGANMVSLKDNEEQQKIHPNQTTISWGEMLDAGNHLADEPF
jgi:hypothetical protein